MIHITRRENFNAAHKLWRDEWSNEKNREVFGKCANPNWHGHNYTLFVTVKGRPEPDTGFVVDLKSLSTLIKLRIIEELDHKNINLDVEWMEGKMASTEILAVEIWNRLKTDIDRLGCHLHSIKLYETENNYVEYFGD
jgi:6-pyruvoyltetrahydropterin/6-carboxytetrahydropterin synthase